jgi:hypothetical protein
MTMSHTTKIIVRAFYLASVQRIHAQLFYVDLHV